MHAPPQPTTVRADYRPDIDGLRAIAVVSVLLFHLGSNGSAAASSASTFSW